MYSDFVKKVLVVHKPYDILLETMATQMWRNVVRTAVRLIRLYPKLQSVRVVSQPTYRDKYDRGRPDEYDWDELPTPRDGEEEERVQ